jgi:hypothetical protein
MRVWTLVFAVGLVVIAIGAALFSPHLQPKRRAVAGMVGQVFRGGDHPLVVIESAKRTAESQYNLAVIARATDYIATCGSNTKVFREIVGIASTADHECPLLGDALDLAVRKQSESTKVVSLAKAACQVLSAEQEAAWRRDYARLERTAEFSSVDSALAKLRDR